MKSLTARRLGIYFGSSAPLGGVYFVLFTLLAWTTTASLFIVLKLAPLTRGAPLITYYSALCCLFPWLAGCVFWVKITKRAKLGIADKEATGFCFSIIFLTLGAAYVALVSIEMVLLWILAGVR